MPVILQYFIKLSLSLTAIYIFYRIVLRPLTFYKWNRFFLIGYSALAFFIPLIDINAVLKDPSIQNSEVIQLIPSINAGLVESKQWFQDPTNINIALIIFITGVGVLLIRLFIQYWSFLQLRKKANVVTDHPVMLYQVDEDIVPFCFGNSIFINQHNHSPNELEDIIRHEFVHVKQKHSYDMIWAELLCLFNWYNPFAWLLKKAICQNLEFIADEQVLQHGADRRQYQYLLLKVAGANAYHITNQFNLSFIRKRIMMMNKMRSARMHMIKFLFVLPILAVLLVSFRHDIGSLFEVREIQTSAPEYTYLEIQAAQTEVQGTNLNMQENQLAQQGTVVKAGSGSAQKSYSDTVPKLSIRQKHDETGNLPKTPEQSDSTAGILVYRVNGIVRDEAFILGIDPDDIVTINIKAKTITQQGYARRGRQIEILTKANVVADNSPAANNSIQQPQPGKTDTSFNEEGIRITSSNTKLRLTKTVSLPLYIIDGVRMTRNPEVPLPAPEIIESIHVLKGHRAIELYGEEGVHGVLLINTRKQNIHKPVTRQGS